MFKPDSSRVVAQVLPRAFHQRKYSSTLPGKKTAPPKPKQGWGVVPPRTDFTSPGAAWLRLLKMEESENPSRDHTRSGGQRPKRHPKEEDDFVSLAQFHTQTTLPASKLRV